MRDAGMCDAQIKGSPQGEKKKETVALCFKRLSLVPLVIFTLAPDPL